MKKTEKSKAGFTLVEIMIVVAIIGLLAAIGIPSFMKARTKALGTTKEANIAKIEDAIQEWALDNGATNSTVAVTWADVAPYLKKTNQADYTVSTKTINFPATIGGSVTYND
ncbi:MAG: prepilin-type N-terminal cleavage/methylation domain-containing protein [Kiritimatiellae bacterium]|nr:prepilin-type N-terminal cleavage/methylation domain-containing protein [Kiritimatiellia bacterium]